MALVKSRKVTASSGLVVIFFRARATAKAALRVWNTARTVDNSYSAWSGRYRR
ncbi:hypothetical protein D3C76_1674640 [compost metagenome]